jgi:hypothetical protein
MSHIRCFAIALAAMLGVSTAYAADNIALGKPYRLNKNPNYALCTDPGDATQLTDGVYSEGYFWTQPSTVGWQNTHPVTITIDLGAVQPIGGASFNTAGGRAGVGLPMNIHIFTSDDNKTWRYNGDLVELSAQQNDRPIRDDYTIYRFHCDNLKARGRYVQFMVPLIGSSFTFVDEIEVHRGNDALLRGDAPGEVIDNPDAFFTTTTVTSLARQRLRADLRAISDALNEPQPDLADEIDQVRIDTGRAFRAVLPLNDLHRHIMRLQARVWRQLGFDGLVVWQTNEWDMISHLEPPRKGGATLDVHMMRNERQSAAFNLSNATDKPAEVRLVVSGLPAGCVAIQDVPYTDTVSGTPVLAALPDARRDGDAWVIDVAAGMTGQVWLTFDSRGLNAGEYSGAIELLQDSGFEVGYPVWHILGNVPVSLTVYPMVMADKPRLHLGGWDYTDRDAQYDITVNNREALIAHLRDRHVDTPWATGAVMPLTSRDTTNLETWIGRWPHAANYFVFVALRPTSFGTEMGGDEWRRKVTDWINFWAEQFVRLDVDLHQVGLLLVDENHSVEQDQTIIAYADVIHAAQPDMVIFQDPTWTSPAKATPRMYEVADILCPNMVHWMAAPNMFEQVYLSYTGADRDLWFYVCSGPGKLLDPYAYHRMQAWYCWTYNAKGMGYWAFGDSNGAPSWNEYLAKRGAYTPVFLDDTTVTAGKHMEAIREGVEDYETMCMLQERVEQLTAAGVDGDAVRRARRLLDTSGRRVIGVMDVPSATSWSVDKDRSVMDQVRVEALKLLGELSSM